MVSIRACVATVTIFEKIRDAHTNNFLNLILCNLFFECANDLKILLAYKDNMLKFQTYVAIAYCIDTISETHRIECV